MSDEFLTRLQLSETGFAFDPQSGHTFSLNHTAIKVVHLLRLGKDKDQIVAALGKEYAVDPADALRDVEDFIHSLRALSGSPSRNGNGLP